MSSNYVSDNAGSGFVLPDDEDDELAELFAYESEDSKGEDTQQYFDDQNAGFSDDSVTPEPEESAFTPIDDDGFDPFDIPTEDKSIGADTSAPFAQYTESSSDDDPMPELDESEYAPESEPEPVQDAEPEFVPEPEPEVEQPEFAQYEEPQVQSRWASSGYGEPEQNTEPVYEAPAPVYEPEPEPEPAAVYSAAEVESPIYESRRTRREEPEPVVEESAVQSRRRINIPSESDQIQDVQRIVEVLDVYRSLKPVDMKDQVYSLITMDNEPPESEAQVVVKALNAEPLLFETIRALREAKNTDPVERVFYVLELPEKVFYNLGIMAIVFTEHDPIDEQQTKTNYARQLVQIIEGLEDNVMSVVANTEDVLQAAVGDQQA